MCSMQQIVDAFVLMFEDIIAFLPALIAAIIVILIGYVAGTVIGKAVNKLIEKMGIEKNFEKSSTGKAFTDAGLDLSSFVAGHIPDMEVLSHFEGARDNIRNKAHGERGRARSDSIQSTLPIGSRRQKHCTR